MKTRMLKVKDVSITVLEVCNQDYISMTDMVGKFEDGLALIEKWLRNKNTIEFLGIWERINNPAFNSPEFGGIMIQAGLNRFTVKSAQDDQVFRCMATSQNAHDDQPVNPS